MADRPGLTVSVVTASWNCAATLADCLDSVAKLTYAQREHVVIDGASWYGTLALLQSRRSQLAVLLSEPATVSTTP